ncbi:MAG: hypothetical protein AABX31_05145 [Nanoarchaeota archaeon]
MPEKLNLEYISCLERRWKSYLRKYDPWDSRKGILEQDVRDTLDDMKNNTTVGRMLYYLFDAMEKGNLSHYKQNFVHKNYK